MTLVRVAFVGAKHPHIFPRLQLACQFPEQCTVVGVFDREQQTLDFIERNYHVPVYTELEPLLNNCDLVFFEGYDYENPDYVRRFLPHVKAIMIEKPGAPTVEAMRALVKECAAFDVNVSLGYMLQWSPVFPHLRNIVDSGVLGTVTLARFHAATPVGCAGEIWQSLPQDEGGLVWTDGCHMMRAIVELLGVPERVTGMARKLPPSDFVQSDFFKKDVLSGLGAEHPIQIGTLVHEDVAGAVLQYNDKLAVFDITGWEAHGWVEQWRIELWGTNATLEAGLMPPWYRLQVNRGNSAYGSGVHQLRMSGPGTAETSLVPDDAYTHEFLNQLDIVKQGRTSQFELRQALNTLEILHAVYVSSRTGSVTEIVNR